MGFFITAEDVSSAWFEATSYILGQPSNRCNNLMVEIQNPLQIEPIIQENYVRFCESKDIKNFSIPAQTIFPKKAYQILKCDRKKLYYKFPRLHKSLKGGWGSYFDQMINWNVRGSGMKPVNQIEDIINRINDRERVLAAAYTIQITNPKDHTARTRGLPCLHYILLQLDSVTNTMSMLAVYRNHDFAIKAYGNYVGLGHLLEFLCHETGFNIGCLTCVSSHAFIESKYKRDLNVIVGGTIEDAV